jgi:hypothetical protein
MQFTARIVFGLLALRAHHFRFDVKLYVGYLVGILSKSIFSQRLSGWAYMKDLKREGTATSDYKVPKSASRIMPNPPVSATPFPLHSCLSTHTAARLSRHNPTNFSALKDGKPRTLNASPNYQSGASLNSDSLSISNPDFIECSIHVGN